MSGGRGAALLALLALLSFLPAAPALAASAAQLVEDLHARGIHDEHVLDALRRVPRDAFAPASARDHAYDDAPLDIGHGQTMSQPYVVALMAEQLGLEGNERVLEIGTGSGYNAAVLGTLAHEVYSVELIPELASAARLALTRTGFRNVHVKQGDGTLGWREYGPYDAIVVTAAGPTVPRALIDQLREGGVLVMPVGDPDGRQVLVRGVKHGLKLRTREIAEVRFVPLLGGGAGFKKTAEPPRRQPAGHEGAVERPRPSVPDSERPPPSADVDERHKPPRELDGRGRDRDTDDVEDEDRPAAPNDRDEHRHPAPDVERRAPRNLNEEELRDEDDSDSESDTRPLPAARIRVARAPSAPGSDRRCGARAVASVGAGSPARVRRSAA